MFRPISLTAEDNIKLWKSSTYFVDKDFEKAYQQHISASLVVVESAKIYVDTNWKKITDWSKLNLDIIDNTGAKTVYYNYDEYCKSKEEYLKLNNKPESITFNEIRSRLELRLKSKHNPIKTLTDIVLDVDGDFSITVNDNNHLWIDDKSILNIATYIENSI